MLNILSKLTLLAHFQDRLNNYKDTKELKELLETCTTLRNELKAASDDYGRLKLEDFYNKDFITALVKLYNTAYPNDKL